MGLEAMDGIFGSAYREGGRNWEGGVEAGGSGSRSGASQGTYLGNASVGGSEMGEGEKNMSNMEREKKKGEEARMTVKDLRSA